MSNIFLKKEHQFYNMINARKMESIKLINAQHGTSTYVYTNTIKKNIESLKCVF